MESPTTLFFFQMQDGALMMQRRARISSVKLQGFTLCFKAFFKLQMALYFCCGCGKDHPKDVLCFVKSVKRTMFYEIVCVVNNNFSFRKTFSIFVVFDICEYFWFLHLHLLS